MNPVRFLLPAPKEVKKLEGPRVSTDMCMVVRKIDTWDLFLDPQYNLGPHGYVLDIGRDGIEATATTDQGLFYASQTFEQLARSSEVPAMRIIDWPSVPNRMVLYDVRDNSVQLPYMKRWIDRLSSFKVGQLMPYMEDDFRYKSHPYLGRLHTFTHGKARELVTHARERFVEIVPQLASFGHGWGLLKHEELKELRHAGSAGQFSPCCEKTYEVFRTLYNELMEAFPQSKLFHVGFDEVGGCDPGHLWNFSDDLRCRQALCVLGDEGLFGLHADRLKTIVEGLGREMMIWHDEIWDKQDLRHKIDKDTHVVIWIYERMEDFHEVRKFKEWEFKKIWAAPAVHGFNDVYQQIPTSFGNIAGFVRAAVEEKLEGVITTTWGMCRGGNAENYFYGLSYAAHVMWNSEAIDIADFNRRFAAAWFGITAASASDHIDRLFWFPWRASGSAPWDHKDIDGRWQRLWESHRVFFGPFDELVKAVSDEAKCELKAEHVDEELQAHIDEKLHKHSIQAAQLRRHVAKARRSLRWLQRESQRNAVTLESMELVLSAYEHLAKKTIAVYGTAKAYRHAFKEDRYAGKELERILDHGVEQLIALRGDFKGLEAGYTRAIAIRNGDPTDIPRLLKAKGSLEKLIYSLLLGASEIKQGSPAPPPEHVGFGL
jgi:Glycosyl hydrolase family 20, catalytic domain/Glycosyl hydrolase family 20, domain 2